MVTQTDASRSWRPVFLISCLFTAALLLSSWWWPVTREYWDALDAAAFYWLHGSILDGGNDWRVFWAYANTRPIDGISALLFASIFFTWIWRGGWSSAPERIAEGFFLFGVTVMVLHVSSNVIFTFDRLSPSLVLEPVFRLSEVVTSVKVKDVSGNSFPGDHGTAVSLFTLFIWAFSGWKRGVAALVLAVLAVLPRLMGGAHWITDLAVGSASIALVTAGLTLGTPFAKWCIAFVALALRKAVSVGVLLGVVPESASKPPSSN